MFKSTDGGNHWSPVNSGLTNLAIQALTVDPLNSATVYAGTGTGVFMSENAGDTWGPINSGLTNTAIRALSVAPTAPTTVYAATFGGGVFVLRQ